MSKDYMAVKVNYGQLTSLKMEEVLFTEETFLVGTGDNGSFISLQKNKDGELELSVDFIKFIFSQSYHENCVRVADSITQEVFSVSDIRGLPILPSLKARGVENPTIKEVFNEAVRLGFSAGLHFMTHSELATLRSCYESKAVTKSYSEFFETSDNKVIKVDFGAKR